jgi:hypothetical protein
VEAKAFWISNLRETTYLQPHSASIELAHRCHGEGFESPRVHEKLIVIAQRFGPARVSKFHSKLKLDKERMDRHDPTWFNVVKGTHGST